MTRFQQLALINLRLTEMVDELTQANKDLNTVLDSATATIQAARHELKVLRATVAELTFVAFGKAPEREALFQKN